MAETILVAEAGRPSGSSAARRLRHAGRIPAVVYGPGVDPIPVSVVARELRAALEHRRRAQRRAVAARRRARPSSPWPASSSAIPCGAA